MLLLVIPVTTRDVNEAKTHEAEAEAKTHEAEAEAEANDPRGRGQDPRGRGRGQDHEAKAEAKTTTPRLRFCSTKPTYLTLATALALKIRPYAANIRAGILSNISNEAY